MKPHDFSLPDENKEVITAYKAWGIKKFMGREFKGILQTTYLIDPNGNVAKVYEGVRPSEHMQEILEDLKSLQ